MEILELKQKKIQGENLLDGQTKDRGKSVNLMLEQWKLATLKNTGLTKLQKRLRNKQTFRACRTIQNVLHLCHENPRRGGKVWYRKILEEIMDENFPNLPQDITNLRS